MTSRKIIIDTDPGLDDILALLLAFSASPEELDVQLVTVTHGNIDVHSCLRNVVSLFHTIDKERTWRQQNGLPDGFDALFKAKQKPLVALGAEEPLEDQLIKADFFHGKDGLGGIHESHPHLSPDDAWKSLFDLAPAATAAQQPPTPSEPDNLLFTPTRQPAHEAILHVLRTNPPATVTIVAVGPLTNLARAAALDPAAFLRAADVVVMGGALRVHGNITPLAEFNTHADTIAAARLYALSSPMPASTMPPVRSAAATAAAPSPLAPYPDPLPGPPLRVTLFPLDVTDEHMLRPAAFAAATQSLQARGSPLAAWTAAFMPHGFGKSMEHGGAGLSVHDAVCVWYAMGAATGAAGWRVSRDNDIRVETAGQWTRGACITDQRNRRKVVVDPASLVDGERPGDRGGWRDVGKGNRLGVCTATPGAEEFERVLLSRIFGYTVQ